MLSIAIALTASLVSAGAVQAGPYQVRSCGSAPPAGADNAWVFETANAVAYERVPATCPPAPADRPSNTDVPPASTITGLAAWTRLGTLAADSPRNGQYMQYALTAPSGTKISSVTITRSAGKDDQFYTVYGRADGVLIDAAETCTIDVVGGYFTCDTGGGAYTGTTVDPRTRTPVTYTGLSASKIAWGVECPGSGCGTGATLHSAWVAIYASTVTIDDTTAPSAASVSIPARTWHGGTVSAAGSGTDSTGIRGFRWYVDGSPFGGEVGRPRACDYSRAAPCTNAANAPVTLDTTLLPDGSHSVRLAAVDAGGNATQSTPTTIAVDNTPPAAPTGLTVTGGGGSASYDITWIDPAADSGAPLAAIGWQTCPVGGGGCRSGSVPATGGAQAINGLALPAGGTYDITVWGVDEAGNGAPAHGATSRVTYAAPGSGGGGGSGSGGGGSAGAGAGAATGGPTPSPGGTGPGSAGGGTIAGGSTPVADPARTPLPTSTAIPASADIHARAKLAKRRGRLTVAGHLNRSATGRVAITYRAKIHGRWRTTRVRAPIARGRYHASLRLPAGWAMARTATVTVRFAGSPGVHAQTKTLRLARPHPRAHAG